MFNLWKALIIIKRHCKIFFLILICPQNGLFMGIYFKCTWAEGSSALLWSCVDCRLSVRRPSVVYFSHFRLLLWNRLTEFNETWQETWQEEARSQRPLASLCFSGWSEKQDGRPGLWLAETFSTSPLKLLNGIQRNLTGSKISMSST